MLYVWHPMFFMSFEIKNQNFRLMTKELLTNLGYKVIKEEHHVENNENSIALCVKFDSDIFLKPQYSPGEIAFIDCKVSMKTLVSFDSTRNLFPPISFTPP